MGHRFAEIAFTPAVREQQARHGSRESYARLEGGPPSRFRLDEKERAFLESRDGFQLASVGATGWPYVQHRGGSPGFVRVLDEQTIGWAELRGNRQYVTLGNVGGDDRVALLVIDHAHRRRLKILGHARAIEAADDPALAERLAVPRYPGVVERSVLVRVAAFDWNCPSHITPRFTLAEVEEMAAPLRERIAALEARPAHTPEAARG